MRKMLPLMAAGILVLGGLGAVALDSDVEKLGSVYMGYGHICDGSLDYTHTVFVEVATSQNCPACHYWSQNIQNVYTSGDYEFEYVDMLVYDYYGDVLNWDAYAWKNLYGIAGYPTSILDGDYRRIVGNQPGLLAGTLDDCGSRTVADISANMTISWLGNATIEVNITIQNNEETQYDGYIRACITEITSRYNTSGGVPFHFGFLDYAFVNDISINPGGVYTDSVIWDGSDHADAHGDDFGDIAPDNIKVIMGVFDDDNGYVDETTAATPGDGERPVLHIEPLTGGLFKVSTVIKNTGTVEATDVNWSIVLDGGLLLLDGENSGRIASIPAGGEEDVISGLIFGFGIPVVTVTAEIPEISARRDQKALVLLFFIKT